MTLPPRKNGWGIQLRIGKGRRPWFVIQAPREAVAEQRAAAMAEMAALLVTHQRYDEAEPALRQLAASHDQAEFDGGVEAIRELCAEIDGSSNLPKLTTFRDFGERWTSGALARRYGSGYFRTGKKSVKHDKGRLEALYKTIGHVPLVRFTADHAYEAMEKLPERVKTDSARKQYAQLLHYLLKKAANPCRIIERSPLGDGFVPKPNRPPKYPFLYPSDDLVVCRSPELELGFRILYGFAHREGGRKSYLALRWRNLDLVNGFVHGGISKTGAVLSWEMFPGTREALIAYRKGLGDPPQDALVFPPLSETHQAELFRTHLKQVGIERPELFEASEGRGCIRFHDTRAGFITVALANNRTEAWISRRTGHTTSQMINLYRREAERVERLGDWTPLDVALGFGSGQPSAPTGSSAQGVAHEVAYKLSTSGESTLEETEIMLDASPAAPWRNGRRRGLKTLPEHAGATETAEKQPSTTHENAEPEAVSHPHPGGVAYEKPLSSQVLTELLDLARSARRWHLVAELGEHLERAERAREAATPKVASIEKARRKRDGGES